MRGWRPVAIGRIVFQTRRRGLRAFSSFASSVERVSLKVGISGNINIDLHNVNNVRDSSAPLVIYLPPYGSDPEDAVAPVPPFCKPYATAVVNYRWAGFNPFREPESPSPDTDGAAEDRPLAPLLHWPTPLCDVVGAYDWLVENLAPPKPQRRDVYVVGSYLGAPLAASLALTESKPCMPMTVRGFAAYNGIYNWTMFLQDHPVLKKPYDPLAPANDPVFQEMVLHTEALFEKPSGLFDPFASPCLFLQTPGLQAAPDFQSSIYSTWYGLEPDEQDEFWHKDEQFISTESETFVEGEAPLRRAALGWRSFDSRQKLPECLLLHTNKPRGTVPQTPTHYYQFQYHAKDFGELMRKAAREYGGKNCWSAPSSRESAVEHARDYIKIRDVGSDNRTYSLPPTAQRAVAGWLEKKAARPPVSDENGNVDDEDETGYLYDIRGF